MVYLPLILPLAALIWMSSRGGPVLLLAPAMALAASALATEPILATLTQRYGPGLGRFVTDFFVLFLLGAVFGKIMEVSGAAKVLAHAVLDRLGPRHAILTTVLACAVLTYGGVSLFVVAFTVYPLALALFRQAVLPERFIPAAIALGSFTFTMTALPGTPAIQNAIPMPYFGTDLFAAPGMGLIAALIMGLGGMMYLSARAGQSQTNAAPSVELDQTPGPPLWAATLPIFLVLILNLTLSRLVFPQFDLGYLTSPDWGSTAPGSVIGLWSVLTSLTAAICAALWLFRSHLAAPIKALSDGAQNSLMPLLNTASLVGFGAVVAALPAFEQLRSFIGTLPGTAAEGLALSASLLAGITGSASGGMSIALDTLGAEYLEQARAQGIDPELLHRVSALATGGLDALPHNGAVITLLTIAGLTHREAYGPIFVVAVVIPVIALLAVLGLARFFGTF